MTSAKRPGLGAVLAIPAYRRLFAAQTISRWGDTFNTVALVVLVFRLTGSGLGVTGVVIAEIAPVLLLAPVAGVVIDRLPRVSVMIAADLWRMTLAALLPLVDQHIVAVYAVAFGLAAGGVLFNPAASSVLPSIVDEDELVAANSGLWSAAVISQIALAPLAGALVASLGVAPAFWVNAASFGVSALLLVGLRLPGRPAPTTGGSWLGRVSEGMGLLVVDRLLRLLALVQLLAALSAGATSALLVVLAGRHLGVGPDGFGLLLAAIGVGAAVGPLLLARLVSNPRRPALVFGPLVLRGLVDLVLASTRSLAVAMGALGIYGVGTSTGMVTYNSLLQAEVAPEARGRVFAGFDLLWQAGRLVSLVLGGVAADALGIRAVYYLGGVLLLVAGAVGFAGLPPRWASGERPTAAGAPVGRSSPSAACPGGVWDRPRSRTDPTKRWPALTGAADSTGHNGQHGEAAAVLSHGQDKETVMLQRIEMDEHVPLADQLAAEVGPVTLINTFKVAPEDADALLAAWAADAAYLKTKPGFISTQLYRGIAGSGVFVNQAVWESVAAFRTAFGDPQFQATFARYPDSTVASPHLFQKVAVPGICVDR